MSYEDEDSEEDDDNILIENIEKINIAVSEENIINEEEDSEEDEKNIDSFDFLAVKKYDGLKNLKKFHVIEGQYNLLLHIFISSKLEI